MGLGWVLGEWRGGGRALPLWTGGWGHMHGLRFGMEKQRMTGQMVDRNHHRDVPEADLGRFLGKS